MSTYILTVALAGVGGWAVSQALSDDSQPTLAAYTAQGQAYGAPVPQAMAYGLAPAPQGQTPVVLNLTTPQPQLAPLPQRAGRQQQGHRGASVPSAAARRQTPSAPIQQTTSYVVGSPIVAPQYYQTQYYQPQYVQGGDGRGSAYDPSRPMAITASNGAIVYISQQGNLIANTGATSTSGIVALGVQQSDLGSGRSTGSNTVTTTTTTAPAAGSNPLANASWQALHPGSGTGSTAISGFEDHSVSVLGNNSVTTYDDSNVFLSRDGDINANTGDTDSSGLNAVDVWDSRVRAGNSGDGEDVEQSDDDAPTVGPNAAASDDSDAETTAEASPSDASSSDDEDSESSDSGETGSAQLGQAGATVSDEGASTATGSHSLVVGADGYDDVSIRSQGDGNITTYDDSNLVIGGTGHVNAQIGDSDTGGTVVMGIHGSDVSGGCEGDLCSTSGH